MTTTKDLTGKKVAMLVANGFEQIELTRPKEALEAAGATVQIISPEKNKVKGWNHTNWGDEFKVDVLLDKANPENYDGLVLPGGVISPDKLRINEKAIEFIQNIHKAGKPIAAICHGPWSLINAGITKGYKMTSWPSLKQDLINSGAKWIDKNAVTDRKLITSRKPDDLSAFNEAILKLFSE